MAKTKTFDRRNLLRVALASSAALLLNRNGFVAAAESSDRKETLIMNTQTVEESIAQYIRAWDEKDPKKIEAALRKCWAADGTYTDPRSAPMKWTNGLVAVIEKSQKEMSDRKITQTSKLDVHHNSGRYEWDLVKKTGEKSEGLDYFEFDSDNRITRIVSFFGVLS